MNFQAMSEEKILSIATPIMDNLMQASTDIDHTKHVQELIRPPIITWMKFKP
jgi:hypothetical protein